MPDLEKSVVLVVASYTILWEFFTGAYIFAFFASMEILNQ
jgi:hypothetical protein